MTHRLPARLVVWLGLLPAVLGPLACSRHSTPAPAGGSSIRPSKVALERAVELGVAEQRPLVYWVETVGLLEAEGQTDIAAGVSGVVDEVLFREGDAVAPGTLLVKIDQDRFRAEEAVARANVERAKANSDLAHDLSDRAERAGRGVSDEERAKARGLLRVTEAEHRSAEAAWIRAKHNMTRSQVRAPYGGRINKRLVTPGSYLEEKTVIATMADLSKIRLVGYVPETAAPIVRSLYQKQFKRLEALRLGLPLQGLGTNPLAAGLGAYLAARDFLVSGFDPEFELLAVPGQTYYARIFYMSTVAHPETHMFEAKAEVLGWTPPIPGSAQASANEGGGLNVPFWPGFTAKIRFPLRSNPEACVVPEEAVRASERGFIAFVPVQQTREDGKAEWIARARTLDLGFRAGGMVEVRQGLAPGELLVRRGAEALEDGTPIRFKGGPK